MSPWTVWRTVQGGVGQIGQACSKRTTRLPLNCVKNVHLTDNINHMMASTTKFKTLWGYVSQMNGRLPVKMRQN